MWIYCQDLQIEFASCTTTRRNRVWLQNRKIFVLPESKQYRCRMEIWILQNSGILMYRSCTPFNSPSQSQPLLILRLRLPRNLISAGLPKAFVNISATWSLDETNRTSRALFVTICFTKWKSTSICFVRAWKTGLAVKYVAPRLSHHRTGAHDW